jgi:hypothetical protein
VLFLDELCATGQPQAGITPPRMIALDLSRLLSRAGRGTPTGIDRVELA